MSTNIKDSVTKAAQAELVAKEEKKIAAQQARNEALEAAAVVIEEKHKNLVYTRFGVSAKQFTTGKLKLYSKYFEGILGSTPGRLVKMARQQVFIEGFETVSVYAESQLDMDTLDIKHSGIYIEQTYKTRFLKKDKIRQVSVYSAARLLGLLPSLGLPVT